MDKFDKTALMKMIRTAIGNDWTAFSDKLFHSSNFLLGNMLSLPELDINAKDVNLNTALLLAVDDRVASGDYKAEGAAYEYIYALLKHPKIDVNAKSNGYSALKLAVHCSDYEIVYLLLDKSEPIVDDSIISLAKQRLEELQAQDPVPMDEINRFVDIIELLEKYVEENGQKGIVESFEAFDCPICFERAAQGKAEVKQLTCGHMFHKDCINGWLKTQNTCPLCRKQQ